MSRQEKKKTYKEEREKMTWVQSPTVQMIYQTIKKKSVNSEPGKLSSSDGSNLPKKEKKD